MNLKSKEDRGESIGRKTRVVQKKKKEKARKGKQKLERRTREQE